MTSPYIPIGLRRNVTERANHQCEYCQTQSRLVAQPLPVDHIFPVSLGGQTELDNLCLACSPCNSHKTDKVEAIDPVTKQVVPLYNPRTDRWDDHFVWSEDGTEIVGQTATGRATVETLKMNRPHAVVSRTIWVMTGLHPPE